MSERSIKRLKKHRKSEREGKGLTGKKSKSSATPQNSHDPCEGPQRSSPSTTKPESTRDPTVTRVEVGDLSSSSTPPGDIPSKVKGSRKRKQTNQDAALDESVSFEPHISEHEPPKNKKCDKRDMVVSDTGNSMGF